MRRRIRRLRRSLLIGAAVVLALGLGVPESVFAAKSMDQMSQQELDAFVQQLNESANWRKYRRPGDPPDFVPGQPVKVTYGVGSSIGRKGSGGAFRRGGLANRRNAKSGRRGDQMAQGRGSRSKSGSTSNSNSLGSRSGSSFGSSSRTGSSRTSSFGSSNSASSSFDSIFNGSNGE